MSRLFRQFVTIAQATATEGLRQPATLLVTLCCVTATAVAPLFQAFQFGEAGRLTRDGGLAFMLVFGLVLAVGLAGSTLRRELIGGTAAVTLSRPLSRSLFLCAKFAGVLAVLLVFVHCSLLTTMMAERVTERFVFSQEAIGYFMDRRLAVGLLLTPLGALLLAAILNFRRRVSFAAGAFAALQFGLSFLWLLSGLYTRTGARRQTFHLEVDWSLIPIALLILLALGMLAALAIALATCLPTPGVMMLCSATLFIGLVSDTLFGLPHPAAPLAWAAALFPNLQHFWAADTLSTGGVPAGYLLKSTLYAFIWSGLVLAAGAGILKQHDLG